MFILKKNRHKNNFWIPFYFGIGLSIATLLMFNTTISVACNIIYTGFLIGFFVFLCGFVKKNRLFLHGGSSGILATIPLGLSFVSLNDSWILFAIVVLTGGLIGLMVNFASLKSAEN
jgi:hypothetical protein